MSNVKIVPGIVGKSWNLFLNQGKIQALLILKSYTNIDEKNLRKFVKNINVQTTKELANTVTNIYQYFPRRGRNVNPNN